MFSTIGITITGGIVRKQLVLVREGALTVGDLVKLWGRPRIHQHGLWGKLDWPGSGDMDWTVSYQGRYSLFLPAGYMFFVDGPD